MEKILVSKNAQEEESILAFVKTEEQLREVIASQVDGLIVIDGQVEILSGKGIELCDEQSLVGLNYVGREGESELFFHHCQQFCLLKPAENSIIADLKIRAQIEACSGKDALIVAKGKQEIKLRNLTFAISGEKHDAFEDVSLVYLDDDALLECDGQILLKLQGTKIKAFELANHSRLSLRGELSIELEGEDNFAFWLYNSAMLNLFSGSSLQVDCGASDAEKGGGFFNSDSSINIFGGANVYLSGSKLLVNEFDTMAGFFVYKNAEISIYKSEQEKFCTWKCNRFWRQQESVKIASLEKFQTEFEEINSSESWQGVQKAL